MGKYAGYCAAIRLGFDVPETWLLPHKVPPDNERFAPTASRYNRAFDLTSTTPPSPCISATRSTTTS